MLAGLALVAPTQAVVPTHAAAPTGAEPRPAAAAPVELVITTDGAAPILNRDDYVPGSMVLAGATHRLEIRGRGNSTWGWPKKPYKIKLEEDASLLGMPAVTDEWVLLANYADRSSLRTQAAFDLASRTRLAWTPHIRHVDVTLNGQSLGLYTLTEQVEQGDDRVALPEDGYLLEIDFRFRRSGDQGFRSSRGLPVAFKDPDEVTRQQHRQVKRAVRRFEAVLYGKDFAHPRKGYRSLVHVGSFIDWYLVEEFFHNQDSNFRSSVNIAWTPEEGFRMGPVWDFDVSAGTGWKHYSPPHGFYTRGGTRHWIARMLEDPFFAAKVQERWASLRPRVEKVLARIPASAGAIRTSALADWKLWRSGGHEPFVGSVHADSFDGEVAFLQQWLRARADWLSLPQVGFARTPWKVAEAPRQEHVSVRLLGASDQPVTVTYAYEGGSATPGKDFRFTDGTLVFQPGETEKSFRVRIRDDRRREQGETIKLVLTGVSAGAVLGSPSRVKLRIARNDGHRTR